MIYVTLKQSPRHHQMTLDEFLDFDYNPSQENLVIPNISNTRTFMTDESHNRKLLSVVNISSLIKKLEEFNIKYSKLMNAEKSTLYRTFYIPKKSGGLRKINAPNDELMYALRELKKIFEYDFCFNVKKAYVDRALYHTSAFAYVQNRCTIDAVKRHQNNKSRWFAKFDLHDFFGSTTIDFVMHMFKMVFPFSYICEYEKGENELRKALSLAFLDGGLPQGTPISPLITNIMMIPVDFTLSNALRNFKSGLDTIGTRYIYTRYADDFLVSSEYSFRFRDIENFIVNTLKSFGAPFSLNVSKTRYGSSAGSNWNLGVMLNKDNEITVGHKKKKVFQAMLSNYAMDRRKGVAWNKNDVQTLDGYRNYYKMVEGESIDRIVQHLSDKFNFDIVASIKADLKAK